MKTLVVHVPRRRERRLRFSQHLRWNRRGSQPAFHAQLAQTDNLRDVEEDRTTKAEEQVKSDHLLNLHLRAGHCNQSESIGSMAGLKAKLTEAGLR